MNSQTNLISLEKNVIDIRTLQSRNRKPDDYFTYALKGKYIPNTSSYGTLSVFMDNCFAGLEGNEQNDVCFIIHQKNFMQFWCSLKNVLNTQYVFL